MSVRVQVSLSAASGATSLAELIDYLMVPPQDVVSIEAVLAPLFEVLVAVRASPLLPTPHSCHLSPALSRLSPAARFHLFCSGAPLFSRTESPSLRTESLLSRLLLLTPVSCSSNTCAVQTTALVSRATLLRLLQCIARNTC